MNALVIGLARTARRAAPAWAVAAAVLLSIGVCAGDARTIGRPGPKHNFTLTLKHRTVTLRPGSAARITVVIHRRRLAGPVRLRLASRLPRGLTARFAPRRTRGKRSVLTLRATAQIRPGRYVLKIRGAWRHRGRTTKLIVTVPKPAETGTGTGGTPGVAPNPATGSGSGTADTGPAFSISGNAPAALDPGVSEPLDLQIENPNSSSLTLNSLTAAVSAVDAPQATPSLPCTASDFSVRQYSGLLPLVIAPNTTITLQQLDVPEADWPEVSMLDRASNQDGCQGASLSLSYSAAATLG